jgi:hypothetical protein
MRKKKFYDIDTRLKVIVVSKLDLGDFFGVTTFSSMTLSRMTLSRMTLNIIKD